MAVRCSWLLLHVVSSTPNVIRQTAPSHGNQPFYRWFALQLHTSSPGFTELRSLIQFYKTNTLPFPQVQHPFGPAALLNPPFFPWYALSAKLLVASPHPTGLLAHRQRSSQANAASSFTLLTRLFPPVLYPIHESQNSSSCHLELQL